MIVCADAIQWAKEYQGEKFHALLCDPPYHLTSIVKRFGKKDSAPAQFGADGVFSRASKGFMGQAWDGGDVAFRPETWATFSNVLFPGAFGMAFASSRGWHRLAVAIEDGGFIIHPTIFGWCYGSGFPKATRIDTQIDKMAGQFIQGQKLPSSRNTNGNLGYNMREKHASNPQIDLAKAWVGHRYGLQALKPALEPIIVFQKPYEGRPINCMVETGAGALNIGEGRIATNPEIDNMERVVERKPRVSQTWEDGSGFKNERNSITGVRPEGRWPANFILGDKEAAEALDRQSGVRSSGHYSGKVPENGGLYKLGLKQVEDKGYTEGGFASRFFFRVEEQIDESDPVYYCSKASRAERDAGLESLPIAEYKTHGETDEDMSGNNHNTTGQKPAKAHNPHPTLKPISLTKYLATLLLPPNMYAPRRLFVPFSGVASEMIGAWQAGWDEIIGIEREENYVQIAQVRYDYWTGQPRQLDLGV